MPLRKLGPFKSAGVACVLQQLDLEKLDKQAKLPPPIRCTRAAEVLVISPADLVVVLVSRFMAAWMSESSSGEKAMASSSVRSIIWTREAWKGSSSSFAPALTLKTSQRGYWWKPP